MNGNRILAFSRLACTRTILLAAIGAGIFGCDSKAKTIVQTEDSRIEIQDQEVSDISESNQLDSSVVSEAKTSETHGSSDRGGDALPTDGVECQPNCEGAECGPDWCGSTCGECGWGEMCNEGECVTICSHPDLYPGEPGIYDEAQLITALQISVNGLPGGGFDIDGNSQTCAPVEHCSDGIDNQLGGEAQDEITSGELNGFLESFLPNGGGDRGLLLLVKTVTPFAHPYVAIAPGTVVCGSNIERGDWPACGFSLDLDTFSEVECDLSSKILVNPEQPNGLSTAGPDSGTMLFQVCDGRYGDVFLAIFRAQLSATVMTDENGSMGLEGVVGGAVSKLQLSNLLQCFPESSPSKELVTTLLNDVEPDVASGLVDEIDAISFSLHFESTRIEGPLQW